MYTYIYIYICTPYSKYPEVFTVKKTEVSQKRHLKKAGIWSKGYVYIYIYIHVDAVYRCQALLMGALNLEARLGVF